VVVQPLEYLFIVFYYLCIEEYLFYNKRAVYSRYAYKIQKIYVMALSIISAVDDNS
jgi:hypothetical protein